ncbi:MAG TPA: glycosyltransferase [Candidatus Paceibacterota bacterium]|nr:glycosyltransferase [Candidatus Paceibacterota bacterium]
MNVTGDRPSNRPKPRILYVITKANWGGAQRYVYDLATGAERNGYEVAVAYGEDGPLRTRLAAAGIRTIPVRMRNEASLFALRNAYRSLLPVFAQERPDIVHLNSSLAGAAGAAAARAASIRRILFTAHGWAFNEDRPLWQKAILWAAHYATVLLSDATICVSEAMRRDARTMPFVQRRLHVIHNGVADMVGLGREQARAKLAPDLSEDRWIGTIAELHPTKQLHVLIEAFGRLASTPRLVLVIMGEGTERARLEALIKELELGERVRLVGHVASAADHLSAFDVFVLPSRSEGLGYAVLEAGLARLPVFASRVGGIPEIIIHEKTGILVPSGDVSALADALSSGLAEPDRLAALGASLRERVLGEFSLERMISDTLALYR